MCDVGFVVDGFLVLDLGVEVGKVNGDPAPHQVAVYHLPHHILFTIIQGDTKKTELTQSLITPEILFSLKQKFYGIMYNLCSQHLQNLNSIPQKLFVLQPVDAKLLTSPTHRLAWAVDNRVSDCSNIVLCP